MSSNTNYFSRLYVLFALFVVVVLYACAAKPVDQGKPQTGLQIKTISITGVNGTVTVTVELAQTDEQRSVGLMYRKNLEDGKGMLFIFNEDQVLSFWMKNTLIPLSIAYISYDGTIVDIRDMYPNNTSPVQSSRSVRYALEVPQGWFGRVGIKAGDKVTL
jgi:uncharacterized membrane protein (UPF0127 family)